MIRLTTCIFIANIVVLAACSTQDNLKQTSNQKAEPPPQPSSASGLRISKTGLGKAWPFTVDEGTLACRGSGGVGEVVFAAGGVTYALNGVAKRSKKYSDVESIWATNPAIPGTKKDIGPLIERGLKLCN